MSEEERPRLTLVIAPRAAKDFTAIIRYTGRTWGPAQQVAYEAKLDEALRRIVVMPTVGQRSLDHPATSRLLFVGSHVIVYRLSATTIEIMRILHQRMMPPRDLPPA